METSVVRYVLVREEPQYSRPRILLDALAQTIVGQHEALRTIVAVLIAGGHVVLEGPPGLAKTRMCRALASACACSFQRIQFTPDLLPGDIVGTRMFDQRACEFRTLTGPVFTNILLADEINRAPANVQAALLEAMEERSVTIASETHPLPDPFFVLATMNPHDLDGTYALPLAQRDRFLASVRLTYPTQEEEREILRRFSIDGFAAAHAAATLEEVRSWQRAARRIEITEELRYRIVEVVRATRPSEKLPPDLCGYLEIGAGPRATLAIAQLARAVALLEDRASVELRDIRAVALPVLRHRIAYSYRIQTDNVQPDDLTRRLIASVLR